ncbi:MAG: (d)CMP kinase [Holosporales bacterium]
MSQASFVIAIDGLAASGKGTLSARLARHYDFAMLDTGLLYRWVGWKVLQAGFSASQADEAALIAAQVNVEEFSNSALRTDQVAAQASQVAVHPQVRQALLDFQRSFAANPPGGKKGAILDGRDIGTVICPDAPCKIFVTATLEERAKRRAKELLQQGQITTFHAVYEDMLARDSRDAKRNTSPTVAAANALVLDTTYLGADEVFELACRYVDERWQVHLGHGAEPFQAP